jgi:putative addiction module component (TIGR02574 family)
MRADAFLQIAKLCGQRRRETGEAVLTEALGLGVDDRAHLAAELLASLDEAKSDSREEVDHRWAVEIERRSVRVLAGESPGLPWDEVRRRIENDLTAR